MAKRAIRIGIDVGGHSYKGSGCDNATTRSWEKVHHDHSFAKEGVAKGVVDSSRNVLSPVTSVLTR